MFNLSSTTLEISGETIVLALTNSDYQDPEKGTRSRSVKAVTDKLDDNFTQDTHLELFRDA